MLILQYFFGFSVLRREFSRIFSAVYRFCFVTFCQDESALSHSYEALTNGLILVTVVGSRKKSFSIKVIFRLSFNSSPKPLRRIKIYRRRRNYYEPKVKKKWLLFSDFQPIIHTGKIVSFFSFLFFFFMFDHVLYATYM